MLTSQQIKNLKLQLHQGVSSEFISILERADKKDVIAIKEQKLLLIAYKPDVINAYADCLERNFQNQTLEYEQNYLVFLKIYVETTKKLKEQIKSKLTSFSSFSLRDFLFVLDQYIEKYISNIQIDLNNSLSKNSPLIDDVQNMSDRSERALHDLAGKINDMLFAITNLANIFSGLSKETFLNTDSFDETAIISVIQLSSNLNSYQYAFDNLSFGEWNLEIINNERSKPAFTFNIIDRKLAMSRDIGLQRNLSSSVIKKRKRWLKESLEVFALTTLEHAWYYYEDLNKVFLNSSFELNKAKGFLSKSLNSLDAEDELLVGLRDDDVITVYLSACTLLCYSTAASFLKQKLTNKAFELANPLIPIDDIKKYLLKLQIGKSDSKFDIERFIIELPTQQHFDIFKKPFFRGINGKVYGLGFFANQGWVNWVRSSLISGGGPLAKKIGTFWEGYIADTLSDNGWEVLARGLKLRHNRKLLTDVDIIVKKEDILIIMQMKVFYGNGVNAYEQWKSRKKIIEGVQQAKTAYDYISSDITHLKKIVPNLKADLESIKIVKPVVITNQHYFNGWQYDNVSIMSTGSLMQILNGLNVKFQTEDGKVIHEKRFIEGSTPTASEILSFIDEPLDWRLSDQSFNLNFHREEFVDAIIYFPQLSTKNTPAL